MTSGRGIPEYRGGMSPRNEMSLLFQRLASMLLPGKVVQLDLKNAYARVSMIDTKGKGVVTDWIRWMEDTAGDDREWSPPSIGELVLVFSPSGDLNNGIIWGSINTTDLPPICTSASTRRKTWGKPPTESFFDYPFWELEKTKDRTHVWNYLPSKGEFRHEIGDKVLVHWTEDFLMWRIGNTQYILKDGSAVVTIADDIKDPKQRVEIRADLDKVEIHANHEASVVVQRYDPLKEQPAKVEAQVGEKTALILENDRIRAAYDDDASLVLSGNTAVLESKKAKAKLALMSGVSSLCLDGVSVRCLPQFAAIGMAGSEMSVIPTAISMGTALLVVPQNVTSPAPLGVGSPYQAGPLAAIAHPTIKQTPQQAKARWPLEESKGPKYPRTGKPKE